MNDLNWLLVAFSVVYWGYYLLVTWNEPNELQ